MALLLLLAYIFLPFLYIWPGDTFETEAAMVIDHAQVPPILGKRQFMVQVIAWLSQLLQMAPFPVQRLMTFICGGASLWLTYAFVRRFHSMSLLRFLLLAFAAPAWLVSLEVPSDTAPAFLLFLIALLLPLRSYWFLPVAALSGALAIMFRGDALPILGAVPLSLAAAVWPRLTKDGWPGLGAVMRDRAVRRAVVAGLTYPPLLLGALALLCLPYNVGPFSLIRQILDEGASLLILAEYRIDTWLKVFSIGWILLAPFYVGFLVKESRRHPTGWLRAWPVIPIVVYVYGYWDAMCQPRYVIYITPFLMIMTAEAVPFAIEWMGRRLRHGRAVFAVVAIALVFNPLGPRLFQGRGNSDNLFERISINMNGGRTYAPLFGATLPAINFIRHRAMQACMSVPVRTTRDMLNSPDKDTVIVFVWAVEWWHFLATEQYYAHFKLTRSPFNGVDLFNRKDLSWYHLPYDPDRSHRIDDYSYGGKRTIEFYMGDGAIDIAKAQQALDRFLTVEVPSGRYAPIDFSRVQVIESWGTGSSFYPHYFNPEALCTHQTLKLTAGSDGARLGKPETAVSAPMLLAESKLPPSALMAQRKKQNADWLETIPDYEMRLYDRVQVIKNRQVSLERTVWFQFIILVVVIAAAARWLARRQGASRPGPIARLSRWLMIGREVRRLEATTARLEQSAAGSPEAVAAAQAIKDSIERLKRLER